FSIFQSRHDSFLQCVVLLPVDISSAFTRWMFGKYFFFAIGAVPFLITPQACVKRGGRQSPSAQELTCNLFKADFPALPHANLRVLVSEVRTKLRSVPVHARRAVPGVSEGALPVAEVGTREGETFARHGRGSHFQGIGILRYRLSEPVV